MCAATPPFCAITIESQDLGVSSDQFNTLAIAEARQRPTIEQEIRNPCPSAAHQAGTSEKKANSCCHYISQVGRHYGFTATRYRQYPRGSLPGIGYLEIIPPNM